MCSGRVGSLSSGIITNNIFINILLFDELLALCLLLLDLFVQFTPVISTLSLFLILINDKSRKGQSVIPFQNGLYRHRINLNSIQQIQTINEHKSNMYLIILLLQKHCQLLMIDLIFGV